MTFIAKELEQTICKAFKMESLAVDSHSYIENETEQYIEVSALWIAQLRNPRFFVPRDSVAVAAVRGYDVSVKTWWYRGLLVFRDESRVFNYCPVKPIDLPYPNGVFTTLNAVDLAYFDEEFKMGWYEQSWECEFMLKSRHMNLHLEFAFDGNHPSRKELQDELLTTINQLRWLYKNPEVDKYFRSRSS